MYEDLTYALFGAAMLWAAIQRLRGRDRPLERMRDRWRRRRRGDRPPARETNAAPPARSLYSPPSR